MTHLTPAEIANWIAVYVTVGLCCAIAVTLSVGVLAVQLVRERASTEVRGPPLSSHLFAKDLVALAEALLPLDTSGPRDRGLVCRDAVLVLISDSKAAESIARTAP